MSEPSVTRPRRWDKPFSLEAGSENEMTDSDVEELLQIPPFCQIDSSGFKRSLSLQEILKNDARIVGFDDGDIIRIHMPIRTNDNVVFTLYESTKDKDGTEYNLKTGHYYYY